MAPRINTKESEKLVPRVAPRTWEMVSFSYQILFLCSVTFYTYLFMQNRSAALLRLPWERKEKLLYIRMHRIYIVALCDNWTVCNFFLILRKKLWLAFNLLIFFFRSSSCIFLCHSNVKWGGVEILEDTEGWGLARGSFHGEGSGTQGMFITISF